MSELTSLQEGPDALHNALEASSAPHDVLDVSVEGIFVVRCSLGIPGSIVKSDDGLAELGVASNRRTAMLYIKRERGEGMCRRTYTMMAFAAFVRFATVPTWGSVARTEGQHGQKNEQTTHLSHRDARQYHRGGARLRMGWWTAECS